ncbi:MurR/RpiR family transcriptional regulator [Salinarimonas rosea]|uniref:MurR/RpiR family transcriptional regulator n=1 Tax=Salinarimonas rosea TaxID=552063 RepID=UPI000427749B|nr:MurR/RpiR family transcriptional regulator [Salinarimonas rosea]
MADGGTEHAPTLMDRITASFPSLTNAERRAARALLARYPSMGLDTVGLFAERAGVSGPTVLRFIAKLGFSGYAEFRRALREEMEAMQEFPLTRPSQASGGASDIEPLGEKLAATIADTLAMCQGADAARFLDLVRDERRIVYLLGGDFTEAAARHLEFHLRKMRPRVVLLDHDLVRRADVLADLRRNDVLIAFDIRRYQRDTVATLRLARGRGAKTVLFTDQWMSDGAEFADLAFRTRVDGPSRWDSLVGMIALVEVLAQKLDERVWPNARKRIEVIESQRAALQAGAVLAPRPEEGGAEGD